MGAAFFSSKLSLKIVRFNGALRQTTEALRGTNRPRLAFRQSSDVFRALPESREKMRLIYYGSNLPRTCPIIKRQAFGGFHHFMTNPNFYREFGARISTMGLDGNYIF